MWPCGLMDKALVFGTKDCRFESCLGQIDVPYKCMLRPWIRSRGGVAWAGACLADGARARVLAPTCDAPLPDATRRAEVSRGIACAPPEIPDVGAASCGSVGDQSDKTAMRRASIYLRPSQTARGCSCGCVLAIVLGGGHVGMWWRWAAEVGRSGATLISQLGSLGRTQCPRPCGIGFAPRGGCVLAAAVRTSACKQFGGGGGGGGGSPAAALRGATRCARDVVGMRLGGRI